MVDTYGIYDLKGDLKGNFDLAYCLLTHFNIPIQKYSVFERKISTIFHKYIILIKWVISKFQGWPFHDLELVLAQVSLFSDIPGLSIKYNLAWPTNGRNRWIKYMGQINLGSLIDNQSLEMNRDEWETNQTIVLRELHANIWPLVGNFI